MFKAWKYICILFLFLFLYVFFEKNKRQNNPFNHTQQFCQEWQDTQIKSGKDIVFHIQQGKAKMTLPNRNYKTGHYALQDGMCITSNIHFYLRLKDLNIEKEGKIHDSMYDRIWVMLDDLQQAQIEIHNNFKEISINQSDNELYETRFLMKNYPLWLYPKFSKRIGNSIYQDSYLYGINGYNNPLTNRPQLISCRFQHPNPNVWNMTNEQLIYQEMTQSNSITRGIYYPCRGTLYVVIPKTGIKATVYLTDGAIPYVDEIYPKLEFFFKQTLSTQ